MLSNAEIAKKLVEIRLLLEMAGESFYKYMAFEKAAASVENASPLADVAADGGLLELPSVGKSIAVVIEQLLTRGSADQLDELHARFPATILEVLEIDGVGTKSAAMLFTEYGIASLADLQGAVADGRLIGAPRIGAKTIEKWKRGMLMRKGRNTRTPLARARAVANEVIAYLREGPPVQRLTCAGSVRRHEETVGDVDVVCTSDEPTAVTAYFARWPRAEAVVAEGPTKTSLWLSNGLQIDLRVLPDKVYGNLLQHFTGSREHNIKLREHAVRKSLRVSENGIVNLVTGQTTAYANEDEVYAALGMQPIPPELRSGLDEIDVALAHALPTLLQVTDLQGDFHMHSTWSDGRDTLEAMIIAAKARGYAYHAMSDHSWGRGKQYGLDPQRLLEQRTRIAELDAQLGIRTLCASEVDILPDGRLDYDDEVLAQLDLVVASVHSAFNLDREAMTHRIIRACENPYVTIIGHPTGRQFETFPGYEFDYDAVFAAAARTGTALEIDGQAMRLDLPAPLIRRAKSFGVTFSVDSDAHSIADLANVELAVGQARRAGLTKSSVLNARSLEGVVAFVAQKRGRA